MLRGGLQDFPSPSTSLRAPSKKGKSQRQGQYHRSWSKQASRGSRSQFPCNPILGSPDQPRIQRAHLQRSEQKIVRNIMNSS